MVTVTECTTLGKGRLRFHLDNGTELVLYRGEAKQFRMREGSTLSDEEEHQLIYEVVGKRAKRRTMHLLEQMDRTEQQLRTKLMEGGYPSEIVEQTLEYVKGFHYIDDVRYARTYMEYRKTGRSLRQMERELYQKGISRADFQKASEEMEAPDEEQQVRQWIMKKRFDAETADRQERDRLIRFLLRRGYGMAVIQRVLRGSEEIE